MLLGGSGAWSAGSATFLLRSSGSRFTSPACSRPCSSAPSSAPCARSLEGERNHNISLVGRLHFYNDTTQATYLNKYNAYLQDDKDHFCTILLKFCIQYDTTQTSLINKNNIYLQHNKDHFWIISWKSGVVDGDSSGGISSLRGHYYL